MKNKLIENLMMASLLFSAIDSTVVSSIFLDISKYFNNETSFH